LALLIFGLSLRVLDPNRDAVLLLDLADGDRAISAIQHALDQGALCVTRPIRKLWHRGRK
jgi:hypothetical protein